MDSQQEMQEFFSMIAPSLKHKVTAFVIEEALQNNLFLKKRKSLIKNMLNHITMGFYLPEERIITQNDSVYEDLEEGVAKFYILGKGECEVFVKDEN